MPFPWALAGLYTLNAGLNVASSAINTRRQYKYAMRLADAEFQRNYQMWQEMNAYNHPKAQMERLAEAGLNPHLVYGNGGTTVTAASAPQYNASAFAPQPVDLTVADTIEQYYDIQRKTKELKYLDEQVKMQQLTNEGIAIDNVMKSLNVDMRKIDKEYHRLYTAGVARKVMAESEIASAQGIYEHRIAQEDILSRRVDSYIRKLEAEAQMLENNLSKQKLEIELAKRDIELKDLELALRKNGLTYNDPLYWRALSILLERLNINLKSVLK